MPIRGKYSGAVVNKQTGALEIWISQKGSGKNKNSGGNKKKSFLGHLAATLYAASMERRKKDAPKAGPRSRSPAIVPDGWLS